MLPNPPDERRYDKRGRDITAKIAKMKAKNPRPASGIPAGGEGWGGPAKGFEPGGEGFILTDENRARDLPKDPVTGQFTPSQRTLDDAEVKARICDFYETVMCDKNESTLNRLAGADKLGDRRLGKPLQTVAGKDGAALFPALKVTVGDGD